MLHSGCGLQVRICICICKAQSRLCVHGRHCDVFCLVCTLTCCLFCLSCTYIRHVVSFLFFLRTFKYLVSLRFKDGSLFSNPFLWDCAYCTYACSSLRACSWFLFVQANSSISFLDLWVFPKTTDMCKRDKSFRTNMQVYVCIFEHSCMHCMHTT